MKDLPTYLDRTILPKVKPMDLPTLEQAWEDAIAALPKLVVCACGYKHDARKEWDHEFVANSLDGWGIEVYRYPQPSTFNQYDIVQEKHVDDRGNQWHFTAKPSVGSHYQNAISVRAPDQIRGLVRLKELLNKVVVLNPYGWMIPIKGDYCRDMYEDEPSN